MSAIRIYPSPLLCAVKRVCFYLIDVHFGGNCRPCFHLGFIILQTFNVGLSWDWLLRRVYMYHLNCGIIYFFLEAFRKNEFVHVLLIVLKMLAFLC